MRKYEDLSLDEKGRAIEQCLGQLLKDFVAGYICFSDEENADTAQAVIDKIIEEAREQQDMRLAVGWILEAEYADAKGVIHKMADELRGMAKAEASTCWYASLHDRIVYLEAERQVAVG